MGVGDFQLIWFDLDLFGFISDDLIINKFIGDGFHFVDIIMVGDDMNISETFVVIVV